jgi:hypothetical protein
MRPSNPNDYRHRLLTPVGVWAVVLLGLAADGFAQEATTRADELRRAREAKAAQVAPPKQTGLERALIWLENDRFLERVLSPAVGFYPVLGSVTTGGGFAIGPGYRRSGLLGGQVDLRVSGAGTFQRYWMVDATATMPRLAEGRVFADVGARRYDFPSEEFFGVGATSRREDKVTYGLRNLVVGGGAGVRPRPWLSLTGRVDWLTPRVDGGADDRPIQDVFDDASAPGLARHTDFLRYEVSADVNYRQPLGNPRRGGQYVFTYSHFDDRDLGAYSFSRVDVDLQQYVPVFTERRVLALRLMTSASDAATQNQVPFYLQRTLGGPDDLRGFRRFRFRDENLLLLQAEYRWEIFTAVDGALFYDAGKVASRVEDIDLSDLESDYGIGFRFGTTNGVFLRVEGAFGSRGGKHFVLRYGHVF